MQRGHMALAFPQSEASIVAIYCSLHRVNIARYAVYTLSNSWVAAGSKHYKRNIKAECLAHWYQKTRVLACATCVSLLVGASCNRRSIG